MLRDTSTQGRPDTNGVAGRCIRKVVEGTRAALLQVGLPSVMGIVLDDAFWECLKGSTPATMRSAKSVLEFFSDDADVNDVTLHKLPAQTVPSLKLSIHSAITYLSL